MYSYLDAGQHVSLALDHAQGKPYISYYDANYESLRMAKYVGSGGNCGTNNDWMCEVVDDVGNVGQYSSIAIDPVDNRRQRSGFAGAGRARDQPVPVAEGKRQHFRLLT